MTATLTHTPATDQPVARQRTAAAQAAARIAAASPRPPQRRRARTTGHDPVEYLPGATEFSDEHSITDPTAVIRLFREACPELCEQHIEATTPQREPGEGGAPRMAGSFALAFLAHILTGDPDWEPFYVTHRASELWAACGFERVPSWQTMRSRFCELEHPRYVAAFTRAAEQLIHIARHFEPRIGRSVDIDSTAAHSHATLEHACPNKDWCKRHGGRGRKPPKKLAKAADDEVAADRHRTSRRPEQAAEPDGAAAEARGDEQRPWRRDKLYKLPDQTAERLGLDISQHRWYFLNGHFLRCRDRSAGVRMYTGKERVRRKRVWVGGYMSAAVDHFIGAPLAVHLFAADINETHQHDELFRALDRALGGRLPDEAVYDAGYAIEAVYKHNTLRGVATVAPARDPAPNRPFAALRTHRYDEHGMPRCRYCGGITHQDGPRLGFSINGVGDPRIAYRCQYPWTPECRDRVQTISCREQWRILTPLNRLQPRFHNLLESHSSYERVFKDWRSRYGVAGNNHTNRSKRMHGVQAQHLRAAAALLAEWFRICLRHGWVGRHRRLNTSPAQRHDYGRLPLDRIHAYRREQRLFTPYGPAADRFGITGRDQDPVFGPAPPDSPDPPW